MKERKRQKVFYLICKNKIDEGIKYKGGRKKREKVDIRNSTNGENLSADKLWRKGRKMKMSKANGKQKVIMYKIS